MKRFLNCIIVLFTLIALTGCKSDPKPNDKNTMMNIRFFADGYADEDTEAIIFGKKSDYKSISKKKGTPVDVAESGSISLYYDDDVIYILSNKVIYFNDGDYGNKRSKSTHGMFNCSGCKLEEIVFDNINTSLVEDMSYMFFGCEYLKELDLSSFNTENVEDMSNMFADCYDLEEVDVSSFNTENVEDMSYMFEFCESLVELDLSNFDTSNVRSMAHMICSCYSLEEIDVSSFNTENVEDMEYMFYDNESLEYLDLTSFDSGSVTNSRYMFSGCYADIDFDDSKWKIKR